MSGETIGARDRELLERWRQHGDESARSELVERMLPLARALARRYANRGEPLDDLEQVASVGLIKAIDRFDPGRGVRLSTFAVPTIVGEIRRHFRDRSWMIRVPREVQELNHRLLQAREALTRELGRAPLLGELTAAAGTTTEAALEAIRATTAFRAASLDAPAGDGVARVEVMGRDDDGFDRAEDRALLSGGLAALGVREREIVRLRFCEELSQRQIAERVGVSQMHVSRLLRRSVETLRRSLAEVPRAA